MSSSTPESPSRLAVLMFTDIAGSVDHKRRLGTRAYADAAAHHDRLLRSLVAACGPGELLSDLGDGFMLRFDTASSAAECALRFQRALAQAEAPVSELRVRIGVAQGEITEIAAAEGEKSKVYGLPADLAARMQSLALPGQVLLARSAFDDARQYLRSLAPADGADDGPELRWMAHGPFVMKGFDEPLEVFEVGISGISPLRPPTDSEKARRAVPAGEESIYDWRPAIGQRVPRREGWTLTRRLGEGGFGEVWIGENARMRDQRVFKFCFDADRLRSFKRELTLFRVLREVLGDRRDIARLYEVNFDSPPYYLESEYSALGDLRIWAGTKDGIANVPIEERLEIVARVAEAVAAAHSVGVLHKDIKPSNILMELDDGEPRPKLADFGIGVLTDRSLIKGAAITATGLTLAQLTDNESSRTGTRMYSPPESLTGAPFTTAGDVYALGVLLFQMAVGDLDRPLAPGWERQISDEVLRSDIAQAVDGDPVRRTSSAAAFAERLRSLDERRRQLRRRRRSKRAGIALGVTGAVLGISTGVMSAIAARERQLRLEVERQKQVSDSVISFLSDDLFGGDTMAHLGTSARVVDVVDEAAASFAARGQQAPDAERAIHRTLALINARLGRAAQAVTQFEAAQAVTGGSGGIDERQDAEFRVENAEALWRQGEVAAARTQLDDLLQAVTARYGPDDPLTLDVMNQRANLLKYEGKPAEAEAAYREVITRRTAALGADHRETLLSRYNLALALVGQERYDEAITLFKEVLEGQRRALGHDDPYTVWTQTELASVIYRKGRATSDQALLREAREGLTQAVEKHRSVSGPRHWRTLEATVNLAGVTAMLGDAPAAMTLYADALAGYREVRGPTHPHTIVVTNRYADLLAKAGRTPEACVLARRSLGELTAEFGAHHERVTQQQNMIAALNCP